MKIWIKTLIIAFVFTLANLLFITKIIPKFYPKFTQNYFDFIVIDIFNGNYYILGVAIFLLCTTLIYVGYKYFWQD